MADTLTQNERSTRMSLIRGKNTKPEIIVRKLIHGMGYRYRLHAASLPGKPDIVFSSRAKVIFVHGCFWHRHRDAACKFARLPKSREHFWTAKLEQNRVRDERIIRELAEAGWQSLIVWECQLSDIASVSDQVRSFLKT